MTESRNTIQRKLVLAAVMELKNHPTPDEVYYQVQQKHPSISRSTVYRNLNFLCDNGTLQRIPVPDSAVHVDHNTHSHYHCVCKRCKKVWDVQADADDLTRPLPPDTATFHFEQKHIVYFGRCADCT